MSFIQQLQKRLGRPDPGTYTSKIEDEQHAADQIDEDVADYLKEEYPFLGYEIRRGVKLDAASRQKLTQSAFELAYTILHELRSEWILDKGDIPDAYYNAMLGDEFSESLAKSLLIAVWSEIRPSPTDNEMHKIITGESIPSRVVDSINGCFDAIPLTSKDMAHAHPTIRTNIEEIKQIFTEVGDEPEEFSSSAQCLENLIRVSQSARDYIMSRLDEHSIQR